VGTKSESIKKVESLFDILIKTATGRYDPPAFRSARDPYTQLRIDILSDDELRPKMPSFLRGCPTLDDFSGFIRDKGNPAERRSYLDSELAPGYAFIYDTPMNSHDFVISKTKSINENKKDDFQENYDKRGIIVEKAKTEDELSKSGDQKPRIFIIHGHDLATLGALKLAIFQIGGIPKCFEDLPKEGSQTIIEILEKHIPNFNAIIALLTPDDEGRKRGDATWDLRARQNVLIEAGYGIISKRDKSLLIALGGVSIPSDFDGIHRVEASSWSPEVELKAAKRLAEIGLNVDPSRVI
jgi:predicted nucleotide-binding protein